MIIYDYCTVWYMQAHSVTLLYRGNSFVYNRHDIYDYQFVFLIFTKNDQSFLRGNGWHIFIPYNSI